MLKIIALIALLYIFVIVNGCAPPVPSLQDELREIRGDLEEATFHSYSVLEECQALERELHSINEWDTDNIDDIQEAVWGCKGRAELLVDQLSELSDDIGEAYSELENLMDDRW